MSSQALRKDLKMTITCTSPYNNHTFKAGGATFHFKGNKYVTSDPKEIAILKKYNNKAGYSVLETISELSKDERHNPANRKQLMEQAMSLGFEGNVATTSSDDLIDFIKSKGK